MKIELSGMYDPQAFEKRLYTHWEAQGYFKANEESRPHQESFCMVIPPPNVTGVLHMGHALTNTIQDILVRWRRMRGDNTLWLPGTDHAGIATQMQVENSIRPQSRHDLGREAFVEKVWEWKEKYGSQIGEQLRRLGSSLDWSRERFTLDEGLSKAVREVFVKLYEEDLIYRGNRMINWCPRCQTALSDLEVVPTEKKGSLWYLAYRVVDDHGQEIKSLQDEFGNPAVLIIATTRPETLLGDTAVAIHPDDKRYQRYLGKKVKLPLSGRLLPIISDSYVDPTFGTGALKVTPSHDFNDYELGIKHSLEFKNVIGKDGKIEDQESPYYGLSVSKAREKILEDLAHKNLLLKTEEHTHKVGLCQRCQAVAEPLVSKQWFVKAEPLARPAIEAVKSGEVSFYPKSWEKTYFEWMNHIRDWCISRQLWWGHQIPAWYCKKCEGVTVSRETPVSCTHCHGSEIVQDEDVLDTWFSSALWPFSTLGWPDQTKDLQTFYPTAILETGFDILFFWVARMMMMGIHFMKKVPFKRVYLHAMVRDEKGEKMSKTKGNVIDPLDLIDRHGADPLRFTLAVLAGQGRDIKLSEDRVVEHRAFCNKIWNAVKFFHKQKGDSKVEPIEIKSHWVNQWILSRLSTISSEVDLHLEQFELHLASQKLLEFVWYEFCDWYIELSKYVIQTHREETLFSLQSALDQILKLLHPFMPFVTEELWHSLFDTDETLMLQAFPLILNEKNEEAEEQFQRLKEVIEAIRNFRGENKISPKQEFEIFMTHENPFFTRHESEIAYLGKIKVKIAEPEANQAVILIKEKDSFLELRVTLKGLVNFDEEKKRLQKEIQKVDQDLQFVLRKLSQESFLAKAPQALVIKEKQREEELSNKKRDLEMSLMKLNA